MRRALDHYCNDKQRQPLSLDDLVKSGYLREIPVDPMTGAKNWKEDTVYIAGDIYVWGVIGVRSASVTISSDGRRYDE